MRKPLDVSPLEIRDYAASYGWVMVKDALKDGLFVMNSPKRDFRQLVFPTDSAREEYEAMAHNAIQRLAAFLGKAESEVKEEIRDYFGPNAKELIDTFLGTVEELKGDEGDGLERSGEVVLTLLVGSEKVAARVYLGADHYKAAIKAHGAVGTYIKVKGKLNPGERIKTLDDVSLFELVER